MKRGFSSGVNYSMDITESMLDTLKDKSGSIKNVLVMLDKTAKSAEGMEKLRKSLETNTSDENQIKCINTTMKVVGELATVSHHVLRAMLVYMQSNSFDTDIVQMLSKMGKGQEALKAVMDAKLKG